MTAISVPSLFRSNSSIIFVRLNVSLSDYLHLDPSNAWEDNLNETFNDMELKSAGRNVTYPLGVHCNEVIVISYALCYSSL